MNRNKLTYVCRACGHETILVGRGDDEFPSSMLHFCTEDGAEMFPDSVITEEATPKAIEEAGRP